MSTCEEFGRTALSVFALKDAMLYFRHVIPLAYFFDVLNDNLRVGSLSRPPSQPFEGAEIAIRTFMKYAKSELLPPELRREDFYGAMEHIGLGHLKVLFSNYWHDEDSKPGDVDLVVKDLIGPATRMLKEFSLTRLPVVSPENLIDFNPATRADISVTFTSMRLIDAAKTSLKQIFEFRQDHQATETLRRLRVFAYENYRDKPRAFIEDDLFTRISDYQETAKKWGFETRAALLTCLLDSKIIAGGVAGSFLSSYLKSPLPAIAAAVGAVGITIGKVAIELGKQHFKYREALSSNPVSYVAYANKKLISQ